MKTLIEYNNEDTTKFYLEDSRLNQSILLTHYQNVKKMPNEYFYQKYKITNDNNKVTNNVWVLYGRLSCPFCKSSIRLLNNTIKKKDEFIFIDIENTNKYKKQYVINELNEELKGHDTVPIIFNNNKFIGGNSDLHDYLS